MAHSLEVSIPGKLTIRIPSIVLILALLLIAGLDPGLALSVLATL